MLQQSEARQKDGQEGGSEEGLIEEEASGRGGEGGAGNARHEEAVPCVDGGRHEEGAEEGESEGSIPAEGGVVLGVRGRRIWIFCRMEALA